MFRNNLKKMVSILAVFLMIFTPLSNLAFAEDQAAVAPTVKSEQPAVVNTAEKPTDSSTVAPAVEAPQNVEPKAAENKVIPQQASEQNAVESASPIAPVEQGSKQAEPQAENKSSASTPAVSSGSQDNSSDFIDKKVNEIESKIDNDIEIVEKNEADIVNNLDAILNTGENEVTDNRGDASLTTGDANLVLALMNLINSNFIALPGGEFRFIYKGTDGDLFGDYVIDPSTGQLMNIRSGPYLVDENGHLIQDTQIDIENNGSLTNNLDLYLNTGNNKVADNSGDANLKTGDANVALNLINFLNSSFVVSELGVVGVMNVLGDWAGNLLLPKSLLGENSILASSDTDINIENSSLITNILKLFANTGGNRVTDNSEGANVQTGDVNSEINLKTFGNISVIGDVVYMTFVNVLGDWLGQDLVSPTLGGSGLASDKNDINLSNSGAIANFINIFANTGNNRVSDNNGSASLETGDVNLTSNILNFMNMNFVGKKIVFLVVNVLGDWKGNIDFMKDAKANEVVAIEENNENVLVVSNHSKPRSNRKMTRKTLALGSLFSDNKENAINNSGEEVSYVKNSIGGYEFDEPKKDPEVINYVKRNFNGVIWGSLLIVGLSALLVFLRRRVRLNIK